MFRADDTHLRRPKVLGHAVRREVRRVHKTQRREGAVDHESFSQLRVAQIATRLVPPTLQRCGVKGMSEAASGVQTCRRMLTGPLVKRKGKGSGQLLDDPRRPRGRNHVKKQCLPQPHVSPSPPLVHPGSMTIRTQHTVFEVSELSWATSLSRKSDMAVLLRTCKKTFSCCLF